MMMNDYAELDDDEWLCWTPVNVQQTMMNDYAEHLSMHIRGWINADPW